MTKTIPVTESQPWKEKRVIGNATLYLGDCLEILPMLEKHSKSLKAKENSMV